MPRLLALSGFDGKGPACFVLEIEGRRLMLDLGKGPDAGRLPDLSGAGRIDALILSHGHADHTGGLPQRDRLGLPEVHATAPVGALAGEPLPGLAATPLPRSGSTRIAGITVETGAAGHAPGAVWMRIAGAGGLVYTGDYSDESRLWPCEPPLPAQAALIDASYGAEDEALAQQSAALLAEAGPLLLPAPAGGRGLEMAAAFLEAGHEVSLCPAHLRVARQMLGFPDWLAPDGLAALERLLAEARELSADSPARGVMIAAGANADAGLAQDLAPRFVETGAARVIFTGHLALGAPSETLVREGRALFRRWNVHPRLSGNRALLAAIRPAIVLPAFVGAKGRQALAAALPEIRFSDTAEMVW
jgi:glyoxylase-like metal-dependent hydrolase (beta-lactamase superfamily II)